MFNLFKKKDEDNKPSKGSNPEWDHLLEETEQRWNIFIEKLEAKMEELCTAAIPELEELFQNKAENDHLNMNYERVKAGINGQLTNMWEKVRTAYDEKIVPVYDEIHASVDVFSPYFDITNKFRASCIDRRNIFDDKHRSWKEQIEATAYEDLEINYQKILDEYDKIKHEFACKQCGSKLTIEKIFFISTYITCGHCQTQNTFEPSTQARNLQFLSMRLAEQRTAHLLLAYQIENAKERDLYHQRHTLSLEATFEKDKNLKAKKEAEVETLTQEREDAIRNAPPLYETYLRAKYDQMNAITPDLKEHNETRYENEINNFRGTYN